MFYKSKYFPMLENEMFGLRKNRVKFFNRVACTLGHAIMFIVS